MKIVLELTKEDVHLPNDTPKALLMQIIATCAHMTLPSSVAVYTTEKAASATPTERMKIAKTLVNGAFMNYFGLETISVPMIEDKKGIFKVKPTITDLEASEAEYNQNVERKMLQDQKDKEPKRVIMEIPSSTRKGAFHEIEIDVASKSAISCTCEGFRYRGSCKHLKDGQNMYLAEKGI